MRVRESVELTRAVGGAKRRVVGDAYRWAARNPDGGDDVTALWAATLAWDGARRRSEFGKGRPTLTVVNLERGLA